VSFLVLGDLLFWVLVVQTYFELGPPQPPKNRQERGVWLEYIQIAIVRLLNAYLHCLTKNTVPNIRFTPLCVMISKKDDVFSQKCLLT